LGIRVNRRSETAEVRKTGPCMPSELDCSPIRVKGRVDDAPAHRGWAVEGGWRAAKMRAVAPWGAAALLFSVLRSLIFLERHSGLGQVDLTYINTGAVARDPFRTVYARFRPGLRHAVRRIKRLQFDTKRHGRDCATGMCSVG